MDTLPTILFRTQKQWEEWLEKNSQNAQGVWIKLAKKNSGLESINYEEALNIALCYGWIDSQVKKFDESCYIQKFSPRRSKSIWSKNNIERVTRLIQERKMRSGGMKEIEAAKQDGRWERAYASSSNSKIPDDFIQELTKHKKAYEFFKTLNKTNLYAITWRLETAKKPETRNSRMIKIIDKLSKGETFH